MKPRRSQAQQDHSTSRPPTTSAWLGEPISWGGQEAHGAGPSSTCIAGTGVPMGSPCKRLSVFPWFPVLFRLPGSAWS